jgi:VWFA-related protein
VTFFTNQRIPVDLSLVLDLSGSMTEHLDLIREAASRLITTLRAGDRVGLSAVRTYLSVVHPLSSDHAAVNDALRRLSAWGSTALYDGVYIALKDLQRHRKVSEVRKQVIVLLSDGLDTRSHVQFEDLTALNAQLGAAIYVIAAPVFDSGRPKDVQEIQRARFDLNLLGRSSGGLVFSPARLDELSSVCAAIAHEMANQYEIAYVPQRTGKARDYRQVTVRVTNAVARTRAGYVASATQ